MDNFWSCAHRSDVLKTKSRVDMEDFWVFYIDAGQKNKKFRV